MSNPVINQTGGANGTVRILAAYPVNTALVGTEYLLALGTSSLQGPTGTLTDLFLVDSSGNLTTSNPTVATNATTNASPTRAFNAQYWNGSASAPDSWTVGSSLAAGTNGASIFSFTHSGSTGQASVSIPVGSIGKSGLVFGSNTSGFWGTNAAVNVDVQTNGGTFNIYWGTNKTLGLATGGQISNASTNGAIVLNSNCTTSNAVTCIAFANSSVSMVANGAGTTLVHVGELTTFAPTSLSTNFVAFQVNPTINQTGSASGSYTAIKVNVIETALLGTGNLLLDLQSGASGGTSQFAINNVGTVTKDNGETTAGVGSTSQKSETGADANVLTVTPAAAAGSYRLRVVISVSAANAATIGWTATWTDSNGNAQTPTNLALKQSGVAAPALTFTTSAAGNYNASEDIDINNAGTNIVIKTTFSGTSVAYKITATIERVA
jgi:hypothetical protein